MASLASAWRALARAHDPRSRREIEAEIDVELEFHLAEAERELVEQGIEPPAARERALAAFGDVQEVRAACRRAQMGGRIVLVRIQWVLIVLLVAAVAVTLVRASANEAESTQREQHARAEALAARAELQKVVMLYGTADVMRERIDNAGQNARVEVQPSTGRIEISLPRYDEAKAALARLFSVSAELKAGKSSVLSRLILSEDPSAEALGSALLQDCLQQPESWRHGLASVDDFVDQHEPRLAANAVASMYSKLPLPQREQVFKPFVFDGGHPHALEILRLGALDPEPSVRERAWHYLRSYAFVDFSEEPTAGETWLERYADKPLEIALTASAAALAQRLAVKEGEELDRELRRLGEIDVEIARKAGIDLAEVIGPARSVELVERWIASGETQRIVLALRVAGALDLDSKAFERIRFAMAEHVPGYQPPEVWDELCRAVAKPGATWAIEWVVRAGVYNLREGGSTALFQPARALAQIGDPVAIPQLLGMLALDDSQDVRYAIGYYGLRELTGVAYDESHGIDWWRTWWAENARRFPGVPAEIPDFTQSFDDK